MNRRSLLKLLGGASLGVWSGVKGWSFLPSNTPTFSAVAALADGESVVIHDPLTYVARHVAKKIGQWQMQHHDSFLLHSEQPMKIGQVSEGVTFTNQINVATHAFTDLNSYDLHVRVIDPMAESFIQRLGQLQANTYGYLPFPNQGRSVRVTDNTSGVTVRAIRVNQFDEVENRWRDIDRYDLLVGRHELRI
jgi:hypothetical protein